MTLFFHIDFFCHNIRNFELVKIWLVVNSTNVNGLDWSYPGLELANISVVKRNILLRLLLHYIE